MIACFLLCMEFICLWVLKCIPSGNDIYNVIKFTGINFYISRDDYFIICSIFNLLIILLLPFIVCDNIVVDFQEFNAIGFCLQGLGFISYHFDLEMRAYIYLIYILNFLQILRLFIKEKGDSHGLDKNNKWMSVVRHYNFYCFKILHKKEAL